MKTVDHSYEQALIMHDNVHIHVIMNIIMTPTRMARLTAWTARLTARTARLTARLTARTAEPATAGSGRVN